MASISNTKGYTMVPSLDKQMSMEKSFGHHGEDAHAHDGMSEEQVLEMKKKMEKMQDIFHVTKLGLLIPIQDIVDSEGIGVLSRHDPDGHTPVHWAALGGHTHVMRYFVQIKAPLDIAGKNQLGSQPIHWACVNGHVSVVDILLQAGISIDAVDNKECTPLIIAAQYGQTMLAGFLMGKGARLQITDKEGDNALHWAAFKGHCELTRLLVYSGFNPRQKDNFGQCPLHLASLSGDLMTVKLLCEQDGADIELEDHNGNTPVKLARGRKYKEINDYFDSLKLKKKSYLPTINLKSIVFGPPGKSKAAFLFLLVATCCYGYPAYIFKVLPHTMELITTHILFLFNTAVMWHCLLKAYRMDPGFLPKNMDDYDQALKQVAFFDEWKRGQNPLSRLCHTCRLVRPLRAKHCRITNRCVKHFDHYCPYIYNVVGYKNRHYFFGFLIGMIITLLFGNFFVYHMYSRFGFDIILAIGGLIMFIFSFIVFGLTFFTTYQALHNITTNERLNAHRYDYLKDGNGRYYNPFDQDWRTNIKEFFHLKEPLQVIPDAEADMHSINIV